MKEHFIIRPYKEHLSGTWFYSILILLAIAVLSYILNYAVMARILIITAAVASLVTLTILKINPPVTPNKKASDLVTKNKLSKEDIRANLSDLKPGIWYTTNVINFSGLNAWSKIKVFENGSGIEEVWDDSSYKEHAIVRIVNIPFYILNSFIETANIVADIFNRNPVLKNRILILWYVITIGIILTLMVVG